MHACNADALRPVDKRGIGRVNKLKSLFVHYPGNFPDFFEFFPQELFFRKGLSYKLTVKKNISMEKKGQFNNAIWFGVALILVIGIFALFWFIQQKQQEAIAKNIDIGEGDTANSAPFINENFNSYNYYYFVKESKNIYT